MISVYKLPYYKLMLETSETLNSPFEKKLTELRNKIKKRKNKRKSKKYWKWVGDYKLMKSIRLSWMYGNFSVEQSLKKQLEESYGTVDIKPFTISKYPIKDCNEIKQKEIEEIRGIRFSELTKFSRNEFAFVEPNNENIQFNIEQVAKKLKI